jgi:hypothetical protein
MGKGGRCSGIGCGVLVWLCVVGTLSDRVATRVMPGDGTMPFDAAAWRAAKDRTSDETRFHMVRSLVRDHQIIGLTRSYVLALLGPPDGLGCCDAWNIQAAEITYPDDVSHSPALSWRLQNLPPEHNPWWLDLEFDEDGRVVYQYTWRESKVDDD